MTKLSGLFSHIGPCKVMVIGDFILDTYTMGKAKRISPEAPVAVVNVHHSEHKPGGAGNVVLNLVSLGSEVVAVGRIGADMHGEMLRKTFQEESIPTNGLFIEQRYSTPLKNRIIADNQQMLRIDYETITPISENLEQQVIMALPNLLEGVKVIALSDYGKGFLSRTLLSALFEEARNRKIPIIADPKGSDFTKYSRAAILKPNLSEAIAASGLSADANLDQVAEKVLKQSKAEVLMITRSEHGISLFYKDGRREDYPVRMREVKDVTGAGDTVLAMLTCAIANDLPISAAAQLSNVAAGIAIEHLGCARVTLAELAQRLLEEDVTNKVFDEEHLFALQEVLRYKRFTVLGVSSRQGLTSCIFNSISKFGNREDCALLVYIRDSSPNEEFVDILASLNNVNFIVFSGENIQRFCQLITPEQVFVVENEELRQLEETMALFKC